MHDADRAEIVLGDRTNDIDSIALLGLTISRKRREGHPTIGRKRGAPLVGLQRLVMPLYARAPFSEATT